MEVAKACARLIDDKKGTDIKIIEVGNLLPLTDYFVLVTGNNARHIKGLTQTLSKFLKEQGLGRPSVENTGDGWWSLLDAGSVVIHLFEEEARTHYDLDNLWADAPGVEWN